MGCTCSQLVKVKLEDDDRESFSCSAAMRWVQAQGVASSEGGALLLAILCSCACTDSALGCRGLRAAGPSGSLRRSGWPLCPFHRHAVLSPTLTTIFDLDPRPPPSLSGCNPRYL